MLKRRRIAVLGSRAAGKSALVMRYIEGRFVEDYYPTIETTHTKTIEHDGAHYHCDIIDTAGQDEYSILHTKYAIGIHGYVLVYSVTSVSSFEMVGIVYDKIIELYGTQNVPGVIVGQKNDITRQVSLESAQALAKKFDCAYIEISARRDLNVGNVFQLCLAEIEKKYGKRRHVQSAPSWTNRCILM